MKNNFYISSDSGNEGLSIDFNYNDEVLVIEDSTTRDAVKRTVYNI